MTTSSASDNGVLLLTMFVLVALVAGFIAGWWAARRGAAARADAAADKARADFAASAAADAATARERIRGLDAERQTLLADMQHLRLQADGWREALDLARDEKAQFAERAKRVPDIEAQRDDATARAAATGDRLSAAQARIATLESEAARIDPLRLELAAERRAREALQADATALHTQIAQLTTRLDAERLQATGKLEELKAARAAMTHEFKTLANEILEEKSKRFTEQNAANIGQLLDPLRTRLHEFQGKVELMYDTEGKQRSALAEQVSQLAGLNQVMSLEAQNLTRALKGNAKLQGNWGELILERVLEASGLRRGFDYDVQQGTRSEGSLFIPDVVIRLPGDRRLVVDSKVSLVDYERAHSADTDDERTAAQRRHVVSLRKHVSDLSGKRYQDLLEGQSLDFVLLFVPIEPAFHAALSLDDKLYWDAMQKNVLLVSPLTLLSVVRLIEQLWRQEKQRLNTKLIADRGKALHDKLVGFVDDLEKVGEALRKADGAFQEAVGKLKTGRNNLIGQAVKLRELGVQSDKNFSGAMLDGAETGDAALADGLALIAAPPDTPLIDGGRGKSSPTQSL